MVILTIDTTGAEASVSIINDKREIHAELSADMMSHLQLLMPMISRVIEKAGVRKTEITHIAVTVGPGSFTGIRIGMTTAKTLAQAWNIPLIPLSSLAVFSLMTGNDGDLVCPMIDARHGHVFSGIFRGLISGENNLSADPKEPRILLEEEARDVRTFVRKAAKLGLGDKEAERICFCADGAERYRDLIVQELTAAGIGEIYTDIRMEARGGERGKAAGAGRDPEGKISPSSVIFSGETRGLSYAEAAAEMAFGMASADKTVSCYDIHPVYLRKSEAERKLEAKELGKKKKKAEEKEVIFEMPPENETITYRRAEKEDAGRMARLDALCFSHEWSEAAFLGEFGAGDRNFYVIAENGEKETVGFAGISSILDEGEIHRVAVHPLYRGRGIAGVMMERILSEAEERGVTTQLLEVRESNRTAIALYKNQGFRVTGRREGYYAESGENALLMRRESAENPGRQNSSSDTE